MAKSSKTPATDLPAEGFASFDDDDTIDVKADHKPDPRDAEIAALKAELAAAKSAGPPIPAGARFRVSLKHGPTAVVECDAGQYPYDAFMKLTGVLASENHPQVEPVPLDTPLGIHRDIK